MSLHTCTLHQPLLIQEQSFLFVIPEEHRVRVSGSLTNISLSNMHVMEVKQSALTCLVDFKNKHYNMLGFSWFLPLLKYISILYIATDDMIIKMFQCLLRTTTPLLSQINTTNTSLINHIVLPCLHNLPVCPVTLDMDKGR